MRSAAYAVDGAKVGVNLPLLTSPFWQSYNGYIPKMAKTLGVDILAPVNSTRTGAADHRHLQPDQPGCKGLVVAPLDSAAISRALDLAEQRKVPVVAVDVAPMKVAMVVRADNRYGTKSMRAHRPARAGRQGGADHGRPGLRQRP